MELKLEGRQCEFYMGSSLITSGQSEWRARHRRRYTSHKRAFQATSDQGTPPMRSNNAIWKHVVETACHVSMGFSAQFRGFGLQG
jgi:hypothetical protein